VRIKRRGFSGTKGFVFPLIKLVCSSFMMSSVPHEIAAHEGAVPVPFRHSSTRKINGQCLARRGSQGLTHLSSPPGSQVAPASPRLQRPHCGRSCSLARPPCHRPKWRTYSRCSLHFEQENPVCSPADPPRWPVLPTMTKRNLDGLSAY
jgi:hypothetical protein